jgi:hypothetical protein
MPISEAAHRAVVVLSLHEFGASDDALSDDALSDAGWDRYRQRIAEVRRLRPSLRVLTVGRSGSRQAVS